MLGLAFMGVNVANALGTRERSGICWDDISLCAVVDSAPANQIDNAWGTTSRRAGTQRGGWSRGLWVGNYDATTRIGGTTGTARVQSPYEESSRASTSTSTNIEAMDTSATRGIGIGASRGPRHDYGRVGQSMYRGFLTSGCGTARASMSR